MDELTVLYNEIIKFNSEYLSLFYSNEIKKKRRYESYIKLKATDKIRAFIYSISLRGFWKKTNSVYYNTNFYSPSNSATEYTDDKRIAVYCCIVGLYDNLIEPLYVDANVDYYVFTDQQVSKKSAWKKIDITQLRDYKELTPTQLNRKIKILSHIFLENYDFTVYVDGVIKLMTPIVPWIKELGRFGLAVHYHNTRDCIYKEALVVKRMKKTNIELLKKQILQYKNEGFPENYGMYENTILIRNNSDSETKLLMEQWWEEYMRYPTRDQISLPYLVWRTNYDKSKIYILGNNMNLNPRIIRRLEHA